MDELSFRLALYQIAVSLMKWQLVVSLLLTTATDILFSWQQEQKSLVLHKYRIFRQTCNIFDVQYICNFLRYRSIWCINEGLLSWRICVNVYFHVNPYSLWDPSTLWTHCKWTTKLSTTTCDTFMNSFNFRLQLLNSTQIGTEHTIFEVAPNKIIAGIRVRWTWWPGPSTPKVLWKSVLQNTATKHIIQNNRPTGKMLCPRALPPEWKEWHFAVAAGSTGLLVPSTNIGPLSPCLLITHHTGHFVGWSHVCTTMCGFSEA
jgi:hypothetical protein